MQCGHVIRYLLPNILLHCLFHCGHRFIGYNIIYTVVWFWLTTKVIYQLLDGLYHNRSLKYKLIYIHLHSMYYTAWMIFFNTQCIQCKIVTSPHATLTVITILFLICGRKNIKISWLSYQIVKPNKMFFFDNLHRCLIRKYSIWECFDHNFLQNIQFSVNLYRYIQWNLYITWSITGIILWMHPANERRCYNVTSSLID